MSSLRLILTSTAAAVATLSVQVLGLVTLAPADFGLFSIVYLAGAFALSLALSLICEAATRSRAGVPAAWSDFSGASTEFALIFAAAGGLVVAVTPSPLAPYWWLVALAIGGSAYRSTARFYAVENRDTRGSVLGDVVGAVVAIALCAVTLLLHGGELAWVLGTWAASSVAAAAFSRWPALSRPGALVRWVRERRAAIAPLVRDSLIMDASSIGTPYALAPILGVGPFGVYRAVSNVAAPVRLLLNPIRPRIARLRMSLTTVTAVIAGGVVLGAAAAGVLLLLSQTSWPLGTLRDLVPFAVPTAVFVMANMVGHTFYIVSRLRASRGDLLAARLVQTALGVVGPLLGALLGGLSGAIWAYALSTLLSSLYWLFVARRSGHTPVTA
ncbi:hypothetical protein CSX12_14900 [Microbacterium sp. Y-01]|uniref:hypothetical protein n=1 Tax=Microbacterium sp. Y-01 TaxID=2048898 RepID=UPI000F5F2269|nr:hypothetical protein [Microbacterium sp. Y-01]AZH79636.1 hypothetical protein CSX12_14900 [Microbacterium sp. Y-01]